MPDHNAKIVEFIEAYQEDPAFKRWWTRLGSQAFGTQEAYLYKFAPFLARF